MFYTTKSQQVVATLDTMSPMLPAFMSGGRANGAVDMLGGAGAVSFSTLYRTQPWVFIAVTAISRRLASMPGKIYEQQSDRRERLRPDESEIAALIEAPYENGSWFDFVESIAQQYLIYGRALAWLNRAPGAPPREIIPLDMQQVRLRRDATGTIVAVEWRQTPASPPTVLLPEDVVPFGFAGGVSPLEVLATSIQIEDAAARSTKAFYENGARPSGIFTTEGKVDADEVKRIEAMLGSGHTGVDNFFRLAVLGNIPNAKWLPFEASSEEAETIAIRKFSREEVLGAYFVPQPIGGVLDSSSYANVETLKDSWIVETMGVHAAMFEQRFTAQIIRPFRYIYGPNAFLEFDLSSALRGSPLEQADTYMKLLQGVYTPNELRGLENLPPIDDAWANGIYVPSAYAAIGTPGPLHTGSGTTAPAVPAGLPTGGARTTQP